MAAYLIGDVEVINADAYAEYRAKFDPIIEKYGGKLIVGGPAPEPIEGDWAPKRLIILEFPDAQHARDWYHSPEYGEIMPIRHQHAKTRFITLVEGWP